MCPVYIVAVNYTKKVLHNNASLANLCRRQKDVTDIHVKFPTFLSQFNEIWSFSTDFTKIRLVGAALIRG